MAKYIYDKLIKYDKLMEMRNLWSHRTSPIDFIL